MPPQPLCDLSRLKPEPVVADRAGIYSVNPHRFEFELLDGICLLDRPGGVLAGYRHVKDTEFWVRGHIPGRPLLPGVLMIETAAQLVSYYVMSDAPGEGFLGFGGVDQVKFRGTVVPGQILFMVGKMLERRPRRCVGQTQGFVDGKLVYEGIITGMWV
jgi:3-hydroxyacyl-[acyl-carrier-protein] dehydratase